MQLFEAVAEHVYWCQRLGTAAPQSGVGAEVAFMKSKNGTLHHRETRVV